MGSGIGMPGVSSHGHGAQWGAGVGSSCRAVPLPQLRGGEAPRRGSSSLHCQQTGKEENSPLLPNVRVSL